MRHFAARGPYRHCAAGPAPGEASHGAPRPAPALAPKKTTGAPRDGRFKQF